MNREQKIRQTSALSLSHLLLFSYFFASIKVQGCPTGWVQLWTEPEKMVERSILFFAAQIEEGTRLQIQLYILFSVALICYFCGYHGCASLNNSKGIVISISISTLTLIWFKKRLLLERKSYSEIGDTST